MNKDFQHFVNELEEQKKIFSDLGKYFFGIYKEYEIDIDNLINLINRKLNHLNNEVFFKDILLYLNKEELEKIYNVYLHNLKIASNSTILNFKENNILGHSLKLDSIDWYFMLSEYSSYIEIVEKHLNITSENTTTNSIDTTKPKRKRGQNYFDVALAFADGRIKKDNDLTIAQLTRDAQLDPIKSYRPIVNQTYNNVPNDSNNIFLKKSTMTEVYNHCIENNIEISKWFLSEFEKFNM